MRRFIVLICLMLVANMAAAQTYNNEWIDYNKTYYKFTVGKTGLYRINYSALVAANLQNTPAENFQLWRNGQEVALYTSVANGLLGTNDFIAFWGERNDGKADKALYRKAEYQLSDKLSLQTDTAAFFLTVNTVGNNLRLLSTPNTAIATTATTPGFENFLYTKRFDYQEIVNRGYAQNVGENVYSSSYDIGEFMSSREILNSSPYTQALGNLYAVSGSKATLTASFAANSYKTRTARVQLNGAIVLNQSMSGFTAGTFTANNVDLSLLNGSSDELRFSNVTSDNFDRIVCGFVQLLYTRQFNFGGSSQFEFALPTLNSATTLSITNFTRGSSLPLLLDLTNNKRYVAVLGTNDSLKFTLQPASAANYVLVGESSYQEINQLTQKKFINYQSASQQGNYLIISNKLLTNSGTAIEEYRTYRNTTEGGGFNAKVYDIDELTDQFAFGIKKHPLAIKNFVRFANNIFATKPAFVLLIGKATTYDQYRLNQSSPNIDRLNLVPTWGWPASDVLLVSDDVQPIASVPVGRLSVISNAEVADYLTKLKQYEQQQASTIQTIQAKAWTKQLIHVAGANDANLDATLTSFLRGYENIIKEPSFGGTVANFNKSTTGAATAAATQRLANLFNNGISLISYFGHSAATTLDYNLNDPSVYDNTGKYPLFLVNGCSAGNIYDFDEARLNVITSLSEKFVLAAQKGTIGFIASTHFGLTSYLDTYSTGFYKSLDESGYGKSLGSNMIAAETTLKNTSGNFSDYFSRLHAEEMVLHGDPAIKINYHPKPDFVVEEPQVSVNPAILSVADASFTIKAVLYNIGKATGDSLQVSIKRRYPNGETENLFSGKIKSIPYMDSIQLTVPIVASRDKGSNSIIVTLDGNNEYDEMSEQNNTVTKTFVVFDNELRPIYPYQYAIINTPNVTLQASTANPLSGQQQYVVEIDTTVFFNSPLKLSSNITSKGGIVAYTPSLVLQDSMVYYWRVAQIPTSGAIRYNNASFVYLKNSATGFNQSHLYQHTASATDKIVLDSNSRQWQFTRHESLLQITHSIFPTSGTEPSDFQITLNGLRVTQSACVGSSIIFNVFDPLTLKPYYNQAVPSTTSSGTNGGFMGTGNACDFIGTGYNFEISISDTAGRRKLRDFMDWIPDKAFVTARMIYDDGRTPLVDVWKSDAAVYGATNTLYHRLKNAGFTDIDSINVPRTWALVYKKNDNSFKPIYKYTAGLHDRFILNANFIAPDTIATIISPTFGPAKAWKQLLWQGNALETASADEATIDVVGVTAAGTETTLLNATLEQKTLNISTIDAAQYPYIKLIMHNKDSRTITPYQLRYWRLLYDAVPEGALAANLQYAFKDTAEAGEIQHLAIAFKNISQVAFADSLLVNVQVQDKNNVITTLPSQKIKKLSPGDTAIIHAAIDTRNFSGNNTLYVEVNPNSLQPEQFHFNNFLYANFFVTSDNIKPVLEVTFDGTHILNNDIVSAKPAIKIHLKDESKFQLLNDTSLISVQLRHPDYSTKRFRFDYDTLKFTAATANNNTAVVDFSPFLSQDGNYELYVKGKDKSGNASSIQEYRVSFNVYNQPAISNVFNYPNPFTTSTAFVFTLTGSEVPQNMKIQILTVTGKIVREITKDQLGPIHIGNNITQYKWDGTDAYGNQLGNGVYLYRVVTSLNGNRMDKLNTKEVFGNGADTDKYFKAGYGKMYLMR